MLLTYRLVSRHKSNFITEKLTPNINRNNFRETKHLGTIMYIKWNYCLR